MKNIAQIIDSTLLKANTTMADIEKLCQDAIENNIYSICINPCYVSYAKKLLVDSNVKICAVVGFPLGANNIEIKKSEIRNAYFDGADEIDFVVNIGKFLSGDYEYVSNEINQMDINCYNSGMVSKIIIETSMLSVPQICDICDMIKHTDINYIKTSTGFGSRGATVEDIKIIKSMVGKRKLIKASGGIKDYLTAKAMRDAGASRIGTSNAIQIIEGEKLYEKLRKLRY